MAKPIFHVAIVGAGLGGLAAAISIRRAGHRVTVLEQASVLSEVGAGIQIPPNSSRVLQNWGLLPEIESYSIQPEQINLRSYKGRVLHIQPLVPYVENVYGAPYFLIHRADFHRVLVDAARREGADILLGSEVTKVDFEKPCVHISGKAIFYADIIIGADGLKSVCRESMLQRKDPPHLTGDLAYRITVKASDIRKHPELAELVRRPEINHWMGPRSHAICYLLKGGNLYNIVLACPDNLPELVNTAKADLQEMEGLFKDWDPKLRMLLSIVQETSKWRLLNSHEMQAWSHSSGKFTLLGDACHATLPYVAQGAAMAVEDGAVLGALFEKIAHISQLKDILIIYESIRKPRTTRVVQRSTSVGAVVHYVDGELQEERDRQLLNEEPFVGFPNPWADSEFQQFLFSYDAVEEVDIAWKRYLAGRFPGTTGKFTSSLMTVDPESLIQ